jgi:oxepin-CoA hydrolase / 3-oxo-5,6-dehydrosuberyl-CoA semialdehyde dehydrogenase
MPDVLNSLIAGHWIGATPDLPLASAVDGTVVAFTHRERPDFGAALDWARGTGLHGLLGLDFQQRAAALRALARHLGEHKEALYAVSAWTGATRRDSAIDIDGGIATLGAYAAMAAADLPSGNLVHEGPAMPIGRHGGFAGTHVLVPRRGVAASRCTSTPSTFRCGACSRSSHRPFSPACPASPSRPPRPPT